MFKLSTTIFFLLTNAICLKPSDYFSSDEWHKFKAGKIPSDEYLSNYHRWKNSLLLLPADKLDSAVISITDLSALLGNAPSDAWALLLEVYEKPLILKQIAESLPKLHLNMTQWRAVFGTVIELGLFPSEVIRSFALKDESLVEVFPAYIQYIHRREDEMINRVDPVPYLEKVINGNERTMYRSGPVLFSLITLMRRGEAGWQRISHDNLAKLRNRVMETKDAYGIVEVIDFIMNNGEGYEKWVPTIDKNTNVFKPGTFAVFYYLCKRSPVYREAMLRNEEFVRITKEMAEVLNYPGIKDWLK
jgi:hypothetical protein